MTRYRFGSLLLDSDVPLPGFDHRRASDDDDRPARFRFTLAADASPVAGGRMVLGGRGRRRLTVLCDPDGAYLLAVPNAAPVVLLPDRRTLRWHGRGTPNATDAEFLVGAVLPRVATAQDGLVLHAATLAAPGGAVLLCGRSGAGKSTLASAVAATTGWPLLGDDAVALETAAGGAFAHPFNPDIRLLDGSVKRRHPVVGGGSGPVPARLVIRLLSGPAPAPARPSGDRAVDKLMALRRNLLRLDRRNIGPAARELALLASAVGHLAVTDLHHPGTPEAVAGTTDRIVRRVGVS